MPPRKRKGRAQVSSVDTLKRRLQKSAVYAHLGAITRTGNDPYRIAAFKGLRKSPYELLTQVYTGARLADMFPSEVELDPDNALSRYPWDSDLFGPVDEDGNPFYIAPPAPVGGEVPVGAPPLADGGVVVPPVGDPDITAILAEMREVRALYEAAANAAADGGGGGAAPVIDTTEMENILREAYERLSRQFGNLEDGVNRGNGAVITVLREIEQTLGRIPAAEGSAEEEPEEQEHKEEGSEASAESGRNIFGTPTGGGSPHDPVAIPRTPMDSVRASLMAVTPIEPAVTPERALEKAQDRVMGIIHHHGDTENAQTAEILRKVLLKQTIRLRALSTPHITGRDTGRLAKIPELKPDDLSVANLNVMIRLIRFYRGTGMPAGFGDISSPAIVEIAEPTISLLATLLLERGKVEINETPVPAPAPRGSAGRGGHSSAA